MLAAMPDERQQLQAAIATLEAQRAVLGAAVVDALLAPARERLAALGVPPAEPVQTLRQVSILFLDIVGSTTLSQQLDPEGLSAVMDDALARGTAVVQAQGGKVLQYAGDSLLAVFGADEAREDDAERAVRCGLGLRALGRTLGTEVLARHGHAGFDVRIGIHTGGVLLGGGVDAGGNIRGLAVNVAARMEQAAPPGALRISHDTYALVRGLFDVDALPPLAVKGMDVPVRSYLVNGAKPRAFRIGTPGGEDLAARMIGRDAELQLLQQAFTQLFAQRRLAVLLLVAEAGVGKSRLLHEFEAWSEDRPETFYIFRGRASPQTQGQPFGLLRDVLAWRFQIADDDSLAVARSKLVAGIAPLFARDDGAELATGHAHLLGHLVGIDGRDSPHVKAILDDPRQIRQRALHTAAQLFRRVSASDGSPVVLQLEDLHWADPETLDFLAEMSELNRDVPLLVVATSRPVLFEGSGERRSAWLADDMVQRITLAPLNRTASLQLAAELLKKLPEVPAALREMVTGASEGNPFYMHELVKMLIDQRAITTGTTWSVDADKLLASRLPTSLTGVLQARLDSLPAAERLTLQEASVIGTVFWDQALLALDEQAELSLPALVRKELALPRPDAALDGLREYAFRHQLLHQVTYDTVLKRQRRELHAKVARWLAGLGGLRAADFLGATAEHYERAGDSANATEFHARAAEHAAGRYAHDSVLAHAGKALALLDARPQPAEAVLRWRLHAVREQALDIQGERDAQEADIDALALWAERLNDDGRRAHAAWRRSYLAMRRGDWPACEAAARHGMEVAARAGDDELRLHALRLLALAHSNQGRLGEGEALARQGLAEAGQGGLRVHEANILNTLAGMAGAQNDLMGFLAAHQQTLEIFRELGNRRGVSITLTNLGTAWLHLGELERATTLLDEARPMLRAHGDRVLEGGLLISLSCLARWQGDAARAVGLGREALDIAVATQARDMELLVLCVLGEAELAQGAAATAVQHFEQARLLAIEAQASDQHEASAGLARAALAQGDMATALREVEQLIAHITQGEITADSPASRVVELSCYQVLAQTGDARAAHWLARVHDALQAEAAALPDARWRQSFLNNIPQHRAIVSAWAERGYSPR
jgi:class 3 adenylate cyclase